MFDYENTIEIAGNLHEGLELAALVVKLSTFLGLPLGRATGAIFCGFRLSKRGEVQIDFPTRFVTQ